MTLVEEMAFVRRARRSHFSGCRTTLARQVCHNTDCPSIELVCYAVNNLGILKQACGQIAMAVIISHRRPRFKVIGADPPYSALRTTTRKIAADHFKFKHLLSSHARKHRVRTLLSPITGDHPRDSSFDIVFLGTEPL